jgi:hypothetical protein
MLSTDYRALTLCTTHCPQRPWRLSSEPPKLSICLNNMEKIAEITSLAGLQVCRIGMLSSLRSASQEEREPRGIKDFFDWKQEPTRNSLSEPEQ